MKRIVTAAEMRAMDAAAPGCGVSSLELMERAGAAVAHAARRSLKPGGRVLIFCGTGNNGADGLVAARLLHDQGIRVVVSMLDKAGPYGTDFEVNLSRLHQSGVAQWKTPLELRAMPGDVVVDALFGTGLSRPLRGPALEIVSHLKVLRHEGARVISADVPSGIDSDSGEVQGVAVHADQTVTFAMLKPGLVSFPGADCAGAIEVADIGMPAAAISTIAGPQRFLLEESDARGAVHVRAQASHKGTYGHVLVLAGSPGMTGAASLCARAALKSGAGLVTIQGRAEVMTSVMQTAPELLGAMLPEGRGAYEPSDVASIVEAAKTRQAIVIGPGIGRGNRAKEVMRSVLAQVAAPMVLDADALNIVAEELAMLKDAKAALVITPHPKEMARLSGLSVEHIQKNRMHVAHDFALTHSVTVVLKGARTVIALPSGHVFVNPTGNPGMATGGTGDVLAGLLGGLLAQGLTPRDAAVAGVYVHGLAGDLMVEHTGQQGLIASDLLTGIERVWAQWHR